ncbi:hypothetical protein PGLA_24245 [Paenibacillus glacialis]|uniref:DUF58 domain-containing protein n=2 Tax=Paenibacillus glacialis TaxID=494026 RepID=A0A168DI73_9BACL|nr:hypothetical protein PGLA_24245 [Paenibacillus glacialis]
MLFAMSSALMVYLLLVGYSGVSRAVGKRQLTLINERFDLLHAGEQMDVKLNIIIPGFLPLPYIIIREVLRKHNGQQWSFEESVMPSFRGQAQLVFKTPPLERGRYHFIDTECISEDILGLLDHKGLLHAPGQFRVMPRTVFIPYWQMFDRNSRLVGPQTALSSSRRETTQINGVRDYVYGDRLTRIHWNATARTGTWKSKEFEHESVPKTMIILDAIAKHYSSEEQFELAVSVVASLLQYRNRDRIGIGLCTLGSRNHVIAPSESALERQKMLHHLVDMDADGEGTLLPKLESSIRLFPKGAYCILVSPTSGSSVMELIRWADIRGMSPSHLHILNAKGDASKDWVSQMRARGIHGYAVSRLEDLPTVIGRGYA